MSLQFNWMTFEALFIAQARALFWAFAYVQWPSKLGNLRPQIPVKLWAYDPLQLAAYQYLESQTIEENCWIICAWKQDYWHQVRVQNGCIQSTRVIRQAELEHYNGPFYYMQQRKKWEQAPGSTRLEFQPENLHQVLDNSQWLRAVSEARLSELGQSQFEKWNAQAHHAPA